MTDTEKVIIGALIAYAEKVNALQEGQQVLARGVAGLLPDGHPARVLLIDLVARNESSADQQSAALSALKSLLPKS